MTRHHRRLRWHQVLLWIFGVGFALGLFAMGGIIIWAATLDLPDFSVFNERKVVESTKIYDRNGVLLYDVYKDIRRTIVPFDQISINIKNAAIAIEDDSFYQHHGVRPVAFARALIANFRTGRFGQGGSTITQQVIKNALLTREKTISRKVKEWILAIKLERTLSKEDILALYLNESPYGGTIYGVEETSMAFFGKSAKDVTLAEAAYLAALPQAPSYYSPYGKNKAALDARKDLVLSRMLELGFITKEEYDVAKAEEVRFIPIEDRSIKAPHFVMYVKDELMKKYGEDALVSGGLRVTTTLDYALQEEAQKLVSTYMDENDDRFNAGNGALVATDPKTGQILVMVGSRDYFDEEREGNFNIATAKRQPGSAFKPFVYAKAFEKGYTPETVVFDLPTQFNANCDAFGRPIGSTPESACYMPENYDQTFRGPVTLRNALAQSINIPAIKTLYLVGIKPAIEFAQRVGISGLDDPNRYGLTLVLGGGEVSLLDLVSSYGVFANDGKRNPSTAILKVENRDGEVLEEFTPNEEPVIEAQVARQISDVLSDDAARAPAFGANSFLAIPGKTVAVKTGTTNDYRDVWIVGYTPSLAVGAWMGNNDNTPMEKRVAGFIVAPMWNAFMKLALEKRDDEPFQAPEPTPKDIKPVLRGIWSGGQTFYVDKISQKLATQETPEEFREEKVIPNIHDILHWVDKDDPRGPVPAHPEEDPQYSLWEIPVALWAQSQSNITTVTLPTAYDDVHREEFAPRVTIQSPQASSTVPLNEKVFVITQITSTYPVRSVDVFVGSSYLGTSQKSPYLFSFIPSDVGIGVGTTTLQVLVTDSVGNKTNTSIPLTIIP